ncbi:MAG: acetyl-CoA hydrolase/transferase C-terminal domain-containing protein [Pseudomonadota bacterium]|nr:acetyl-CoA hydrolase/transferase C-terminal domain-containing protein [Pseudomonadota bacterium]
MSEKSILESFAAYRQTLPQQARIYVGGCSGEPLPLADALAAAPHLADGLTFLGIWIPGVNATDWANSHAGARAESIFISPALRPSFDAGRTAFLPLSYTGSVRWLETTPIDGGVVMISPPDKDGMVSLGVSADFSTLIIARESIPLMGVVNTALVPPIHGPKIPLSRFQVLAETTHPLVQVEDATLPGTFDKIGQHIASLCEAGDTLQFGLGNVQQAVLKALGSHQGMRIHAGMISNPIIDLLDADVITNEYGAVTTGVAIGTDALYAKAAADDRILFAPVNFTHAISTLADIKRFKAINSCIEVDLFGQANAEFIRGRQISGTGGLVDFLRGAAVSEGGRAILALASTAKQGEISRIVPRLPNDATSIARADVDTVVTEHGIATLKHKSIDARARALIEIADPAFREHLSAAWHEIRKGL